MDVKMDVNLRNLQEQVGDTMQQMRSYSHKAALAYVGLFGLAYDYAKTSYADGIDLFDKAEHRGEEMMRMFNDQFDKVQTQALDEAKKMREMVEEQVDDVAKVLTTNTEVLQKNAGKVLARVGINLGDVVEEAKSTVIEVKAELEQMVAPFEGYADLNAKELLAKFDGMSEEMLKQARAFEAGTKNRVTVLRQIDEMLARAKEAVTA